MKAVYLLFSCLMCVALVTAQFFFNPGTNNPALIAGQGSFGLGAFGPIIALLLTLIFTTQLVSLFNDRSGENGITVIVNGTSSGGSGSGGGGNTPNIGGI